MPSLLPWVFSRSAPPATALDRVLREARRLHRAASHGLLCEAMPALRRLHVAQVLPRRSVPGLLRERDRLQRKHFLRTLAVEAGFPHWEAFRRHLDSVPPEAFDHFELGRLDQGWGMSPKAWFASEAEAAVHATETGGRVLRWGGHAVVVPTMGPEGSA